MMKSRSQLTRVAASLVTSLLFTLVMFVTFEVAFDVIMPKGPIEVFFGY